MDGALKFSTDTQEVGINRRFLPPVFFIFFFNGFQFNHLSKDGPHGVPVVWKENVHTSS